MDKYDLWKNVSWLDITTVKLFIFVEFSIFSLQNSTQHKNVSRTLQVCMFWPMWLSSNFWFLEKISDFLAIVYNCYTCKKTFITQFCNGKNACWLYHYLKIIEVLKYSSHVGPKFVTVWWNFYFLLANKRFLLKLSNRVEIKI